jgi:hypothetical protein
MTGEAGWRRQCHIAVKHLFFISDEQRGISIDLLGDVLSGRPSSIPDRPMALAHCNAIRAPGV